jgi:hypothetical protein
LLKRYAIGIMDSENTMQRTVVASKVKDAVDAMVDLIFGDRRGLWEMSL